MNIYRLFAFLALFLSLGLPACGFFDDQPQGSSGQGTQELSKESGFSCFEEGDTACAQENYCGLIGDLEAGLRCCLAGFLETAFSENTASLGENLGYQPVAFKELREMSIQEILDAKALPFGELFLVPNVEDDLGKVLKQWGTSLSEKQVAVSELEGQLVKLGEDFSATVQCLNSSLQGFGGDEIQPQVFATEEGQEVALRDLLLIKFFLGTSSYLLQGMGDYEWGFANFPASYLEEGFLQDINGQTGGEDTRWGDLDEAGAGRVAERFRLLVQSFDALKSFSNLKDSPSRMDAYLNWRWSTASQEKASHYLAAGYDSLKKSQWQPISGSDKEINLFNLSATATLPNGNRVPEALPVLIKDPSGGLDVNSEFTKSFFMTVIRPTN